MPEVMFYDVLEIEDRYLKYAVLVARYQGKWIFCRHKDRSTWECPGGHREPGEKILETAQRELWEETGAVGADIYPVCVYKVWDHGMLCFADVKKLNAIPPDSEIREIRIFDKIPEHLTYCGIHDKLFDYIINWLDKTGNI